MSLTRAYTTFEIKAVDDAEGIITGIASTPETDRQGDILEPAGAKFKLPLPLLWQHRHNQPIGHVVKAKATKDGIEIQAKLAKPGIAAFIDEARALIINGLVRGLSVGFNPIEYSAIPTGLRFVEWEWLELSAVTVPANASGSIASIKSLDAEHLAAIGTGAGSAIPPGATGSRAQQKAVRSGTPMTYAEQIAQYEAKRAANQARMDELMKTAASAGVTLDDAQSEEYDTLEGDNGQIDKHLVRLRAMEKSNAASAAPVRGTTPAEASASRSGSVISIKGPALPKGTAFTRYAMALAAAKGDWNRAAQMAERNKHWMSTTPEVLTVLKTGVDVGDTTTTGWAEELTPYREMTSEFVDFLRPMTLLGRIPGFHRVPFNVKMPVQTDGTMGSWVGEGGVKPVGKLTFTNITLRFTKVAKIVVITDELARFSNPSAEALVRADLAAGLAQAIDETFMDPDVTEITDVRPASILNGADTTSAGGVTADDFRDDAKLALAQFMDNNIPVNGLVWVTTPNVAVGMSLMLNPLGQPEFPGMSADGGTLMGYPVFASQSVPTGILALIKPSEILLADDGGAAIDISRDATVLMDDGASPAGTTTVGLWQQNAIGIRAERFVNWKLRREDAVYYLTAVDYGGTEG